MTVHGCSGRVSACWLPSSAISGIMTLMRLSQWSRYWVKRSALLWRHHAFRRAPIRTGCRGLAWIGHCLVRRPAHIQIGFAKAHLELPPFFAQGGCATAIYIFRDEYEPELRYVESILSSGMTAVDGGANIGLYSVIAAESVGPQGMVLSFEPSRATFEVLHRNTRQYMQVNAVNAALNDQSGEAQLYHINGATSEYSLAPDNGSNEAGELVRLVTLDEICTALSITRIDFVKLDVEGAEQLVLRGAAKVFAEFKPIVMFEVSERPTAFSLSPQGAWLWLANLGYSFWMIGPDGALRSQAWPPATQNTIALPPLKTLG